MYDFYVKDGKKLIDYKPQVWHYRNALERLIGKLEKLIGFEYMSTEELLIQHPYQYKQYLYLLIKYIGEAFDFDKSYVREEIEQWFTLISGVDGLVGCLTPKAFMQMFPIEKDFDGAKYQCKDYFSCTKYIAQMELDKPIGTEQAPKFLMEYWNQDINEYMVSWMGIVNRIRQAQGGKDMLVEFAESQGVHLNTFHETDGFLVDDETGEQFELKKPQSKLKKLFSVTK